MYWLIAVLFVIAAFFGVVAMILKSGGTASDEPAEVVRTRRVTRWYHDYWLLFLIASGALVFIVAFASVQTLRGGLTTSVGYSIQEIQVGLAILASLVAFGLWHFGRTPWPVQKIGFWWMVSLVVILLSTWGWQKLGGEQHLPVFQWLSQNRYAVMGTVGGLGLIYYMLRNSAGRWFVVVMLVLIILGNCSRVKLDDPRQPQPIPTVPDSEKTGPAAVTRIVMVSSKGWLPIRWEAPSNFYRDFDGPRPTRVLGLVQNEPPTKDDEAFAIIVPKKGHATFPAANGQILWIKAEQEEDGEDVEWNLRYYYYLPTS